MSKVLLVDDEPMILKALTRQLGADLPELSCEGVSSAAEALERLEQGDVDVVLSDIVMPEMNGLELLAAMKENPETRFIPVIILTGSGDGSSKQRALELGAHDFLNKPAERHDLQARLLGAIQLKRTYDKLIERNLELESQLVQMQRTELVGLLAAGVAHDLNNILVGVIGYTELASEKLPDDSSTNQNLRSAMDSARRAQRLVSSMRDLGRRSTSSLETVDLGDAVAESLHLLEVLIPREVKTALHNETPDARVMADATELHQLIMNLCMNAADAMNGSGRIVVSISSEQIESLPSGGQSLPS
jgi:CheY-like chemotaxis protein